MLAVITEEAAMLRYEGRGLACLSKDYLEFDRYRRLLAAEPIGCC